MRKAHGVLAIIGVPSPFAHEPDPVEQREQDNTDDGHEDDALDGIHRALRDGDQEMIHAVVHLSKCLYEMARHAHRGDDQGLTRSYHECRELLNSVNGDGEDDHE